MICARSGRECYILRCHQGDIRSELNVVKFAMAFFIVFCLMTALSASPAEGGDAVRVTTKYGDIEGEVIETRRGHLVRFLGIPYAKPPIAELRFAAPEPPEPWSGVLRATDFGDMCPQDLEVRDLIFPRKYKEKRFPKSNMSEDCLNLNIYVPGGSIRDEQHPQGLLPVMFYIHGGAWEWGSGMNFDGSVLALHQQVIIVTFNYRLSLLGLFSTGDQEAPGNYFLLDQLAGLQWVRDNIQAFGGNASMVTLFGNSVGGVSTSLFLVSGKARGLFQRAIVQSGVLPPTMAFSYTDTQTGSSSRHSMAMAEKIGCSGPSTAEYLSCLRSKTSDELLKVFYDYKNQYRKNGHFFQPLTPVQDGIFIKEDDIKLKIDPNIPIMLGVLNDEYAFVLALEKQLFSLDQELVDKYFDRLSDRSPLFKEMIKFEYLGAEANTENVTQKWRGILTALTDHGFVIPCLQAALQYTRYTQVYMYFLSHKSSFTHWPSYTQAVHMDELYYVFGDVFDDTLYDTLPTEREKQMSLAMMTAWGNFAKYGNPNPINVTSAGGGGTSLGGIFPTWKPYSTEHHYLDWDLSPNLATPRRSLKARQFYFWTKLTRGFKGMRLAPDLIKKWIPPSPTGEIVPETNVQDYVLLAGVIPGVIFFVLLVIVTVLYARNRRRPQLHTAVDNTETT